MSLLEIHTHALYDIEMSFCHIHNAAHTNVKHLLMIQGKSEPSIIHTTFGVCEQ